MNHRIVIPEAAAAPAAAAVGMTSAVESSLAIRDEQPIELRLGFGELVLIHRSLQAIRTLGLVEQQDELVTDMLQLIDVALEAVV
jgi:hypothetical protein